MVAVRYRARGNVRHPGAGHRTLAPVALYAAYGSNMDPAQMLLRCPHSPQRGTGWLEGWRLTFGGEDIGWDGAMATVVEDPGTRVFVVLYDVSEYDEKELDNWDGATLGYYRKAKVRVETLDGDVLAWLYVLNFYEGGLPSASKVGILANAAETAGAPADYVAALRERPRAKLGDSTTEPDPPWS
jgi:AIG2-like family